MEIRPLDRATAPGTLALLTTLRVSAFGVHTPPLHRALVADGLAHRIDVRVAIDGGRTLGIVLAAPASYWRAAPLRHPGLAFACVRARLPRRRRGHSAGRVHASHRADVEAAPPIRVETPPRSWSAPGDAWRIIFVGTAPDARGRGVGAALYRAMMADRALVARIARDNVPSLKLHAGVGWELYQDGEVVLAVHDPAHSAAATAAGRR